MHFWIAGRREEWWLGGWGREGRILWGAGGWGREGWIVGGAGGGKVGRQEARSAEV